MSNPLSSKCLMICSRDSALTLRMAIESELRGKFCSNKKEFITTLIGVRFWTGMSGGHFDLGSLSGSLRVYGSNCFGFHENSFFFFLTFYTSWTTLLNRLFFSLDSVSEFGLESEQWCHTGKCSKIRHSILMRTCEIFLGRHPVYRRSRAKIIQKVKIEKQFNFGATVSPWST